MCAQLPVRSIHIILCRRPWPYILYMHYKRITAIYYYIIIIIEWYFVN